MERSYPAGYGVTTRRSGQSGGMEKLTDDPAQLLGTKPFKSAYPPTGEQARECLAEWQNYSEGREQVRKSVCMGRHDLS